MKLFFTTDGFIPADTYEDAILSIHEIFSAYSLASFDETILTILHSMIKNGDQHAIKFIKDPENFSKNDAQIYYLNN